MVQPEPLAWTMNLVLRDVPPAGLRAWQAQAEATFGPGADARAIMGAEWDRYRVKASSRVRQRPACTLQGATKTI